MHVNVKCSFPATGAVVGLNWLKCDTQWWSVGQVDIIPTQWKDSCTAKSFNSCLVSSCQSYKLAVELKPDQSQAWMNMGGIQHIKVGTLTLAASWSSSQWSVEGDAPLLVYCAADIIKDSVTEANSQADSS